MISEIEISNATAGSAFAALQTAWSKPDTRVFVLRATDVIADPRAFYDSNFAAIGKPVPLAEDVTVGDRDKQRTGEIWSEVRYDPRHPDAYRHSANAQPLHTDGSYIPEFPNATLMACVANAGEGGETTFIDAKDVVETLEAEDTQLLNALLSRTIPHARSGDRRDEKVFDIRGDGIWVNWNYYCVDQQIDNEGRALADRLFHFLGSSSQIKAKTVGIKLDPGDAITWKDRRVFHGRNGFVATQESERFLWKCAIDVGNFHG
jgi:alpha-ketoglutarate-dependent taurine dioxygenase